MAPILEAEPRRELCTDTLTMPTKFTAQNGVALEQRTPIAVTGCKPAITVRSHKVKGDNVTVVAGVPSAGKLVASATGLTYASRKLGKAGNATVTLTLTGAERTFLARHRGRRLKSVVKLRFTPSRGSVLTSAVTVLLG